MVLTICTRQNIIVILDFRDCVDYLDTHLKIASKRVQNEYITKYALCYAAYSEAGEVFQKGARFLSVASTSCSLPTSVRFVFGCRQKQRQSGNISLAALVEKW